MNIDDKLNQLGNKIDDLHELFVEMRAEQKTRLALCESSHRIVDGRLDGIHKKIEGNGKPGLIGDMATLRETVSDIRTSFAEVRTRMAVYAGIGVFVGGAIVSLAAAYVGTIK